MLNDMRNICEGAVLHNSHHVKKSCRGADHKILICRKLERYLFGVDGYRVLKATSTSCCWRHCFSHLNTSLAHMLPNKLDICLSGCVCVLDEKYPGWIGTSSGAGRRDLL